MSASPSPFSQKMYSALLRLFPFDFRSEFESDMEETFREQHDHVKRSGDKIGLLRLWWETITGIFTTAPAEHLSILRQDTGYALRMMRKNLSYTTVAVVTLALGIGANTAIVSVIDAVLLKPLPYHRDDQLVMLHHRAEKAGLPGVGYSVQEIMDYRRQAGSFSELVEYHSMAFTLLSKDDATRVRAGVVSDGFFRTFGVRPILGRDFTPADDKLGAPAVLLLSYEFWKKHEHGDPNIVGRKYEMNDRVHTVIGVLPQVPQYPAENDVYMPTSACPFRGSPGMIEHRDARMMSLFGRLKPGATVEQSKADVGAIASRLAQQYPEDYPQEMGFTTTLAPLRQELTKEAKPLLLILLGAAGCVLLIACANVANLTLSRMSSRERELVVRSALGAGKGRLLRQLFTESMLLGILAALLGFLLASQSLKLLADFTARLTPRAREIHVDWHMFLFALAAALLTAIVSGTVSALYAREDLTQGLKDGAPYSSTGRRRCRARDVLVVCQVAFSFVLLIGAGLMLRSFANMQQVDPGFVPQRVLAMSLALNWSKYQDRELRLAASKQILDKIRTLPGVLSAAISSSYPLNPNNNSSGGGARVTIEGRKTRDGERPPMADIRVVSPDYFKTLGVPLVQGRLFAESDNAETSGAALINRALARHYWNDTNPIGRRILLERADRWLTVIGVVGDVKEFGLDKEAGDELYLAQAQAPSPGAILVRTSRDEMSLTRQMRRAVREVDPQTAIPNVETLEQARADSMASRRVMTDLLGIFGGLALSIAVFGIVGISALTVNQRLHEIGIRIALGAKRRSVLTMIVGQGMLLVAIGLAIGLAAAFALTRMMTALLFQVGPTDPATFVGVSIVLALAALTACYVPARRALHIDPLVALRRE